MIEEVILNYLDNIFDIPVYMETPEKIPPEYILIERLGGSMTNHIWNGSFAVQSISSISLYNAAKINNDVVLAMLAIINDTDISSCKLNSNYNYTDTETKQYRYQAVFDIYY